MPHWITTWETWGRLDCLKELLDVMEDIHQHLVVLYHFQVFHHHLQHQHQYHLAPSCKVYHIFDLLHVLHLSMNLCLL
ncbi:hypothetical protein HanIR_Chr03g0135461 [Helianthus annuus]|nr:hypothetical protein HanIR_Chr03g0135461 [Helianthus annuus]